MKLAGGILIVASLVMIYKNNARHQQRKIEQIRAFVYLIRHISRMIECYAMPIPDIFHSMEDDLLRCFSVKGERVNSLTELLDKCEIVCGEESEVCLRALADSLGKGYRDSQIKLCNVTAEKLEKIKNKIENDYLPKNKAVAALCICLGGLVLIILL
jgi:hypothetical protein